MALANPAIIAGGVGAVVGGLYLARQYFQGAVCRSTRRLDGKTVIITGGNTGIGKETAIDLAKRGARVIIGCRNLNRGNAAVKEIQESAGSKQVFVEQLDLASFASIRQFAEKIRKSERRLDILINNAGIMYCPFGRTEDGFELQFGTNHLGHFLLTNLLLDLLKGSAPSRVVTVSSIGHSLMSKLDLENWNKEKCYRYHKAYYNSKLANVLFTRELAKRLEGTGVTAYSLHPGVVETELVRHISKLVLLLSRPITLLIMKTPEQGAQTSIYCAVSEEVQSESGLYYSDCARKKPSKAGQDDQMAKRLWDVSAELVKID